MWRQKTITAFGGQILTGRAFAVWRENWSVRCEGGEKREREEEISKRVLISWAWRARRSALQTHECQATPSANQKQKDRGERAA
jgi:hypothetical protein